MKASHILGKHCTAELYAYPALLYTSYVLRCCTNKYMENKKAAKKKRVLVLVIRTGKVFSEKVREEISKP